MRTLNEIWKDWNETKVKTRSKQDEICHEMLVEHDKSETRELLIDLVIKESVLDDIAISSQIIQDTVTQEDIDSLFE